MGKKSKKRKKAKKNKLKEKLWCTEDLDFDQNGNLCITNPDLSEAIKEAIYRTDRRFKIRVHCGTHGTTDVDQPGVPDRRDDGSKRKTKDDTPTYSADDDGGRPPMDAMCPC
ncbi:MAG TPA: hypothetical protein VJW75_03980 [Candidatus Eisenbacteria bacterium]|nr:hypothetical protein [Candidatus Eisenbacteria bacterium]